MNKKTIQIFLFNCTLFFILIMSLLFAYRVLLLSSSELGEYLFARLACTICVLLIFIQNISRKVKIWGPGLFAFFYVCIASVNILLITRTSINDFTDAILWPLLFIVTYQITKKGYVNQDKLFLIIDCAKIVCLIYSIALVMQHFTGAISGTSEMFPTYVLLSLIPFSLYEIDLNKHNKFNYLFLTCTSIVMLMTSKRSCVLVLGVGIVAYFALKAKIQGKNIKAVFERFIKYLIIIIVLFVISYLVTLYLNLDIVSRLVDMFNGDTNGRSVIWDNVISAFNNSSLEEKIMGHGYHSFRFYQYPGYLSFLNGNLAHNDYLNTLYDYGIVGMIIYIFFLLSIVKEFIKFIKQKNIIAPSFAFSIILMFFLTMVSYFGIESRIINYVVLYWGYTLAMSRFCFHKEIAKRGK